MKRFDCDSVVPDCERVFTGPGDQSVLDQVVAHAAADHGLADPPLSFLELVLTHTRPMPPTRSVRSAGDTLRMVGLLDPTISATTARRRRPQAHRIRSATSSEFSDAVPLHPTWAKSAPLGRPHATFRHECLFHAGTAELLRAVVPFVREGLARDEPVMLALAEPSMQAVRAALGSDADRVMVADAPLAVGATAHFLSRWRDFADRHCGPGRPVRGIGEPMRSDGRPEEIAEAQLHEALLNTVVSPRTPLWLLCPYDTADLGDDVMTQALRSHPVLATSNAHRCSEQYGGGAHVAALYCSAFPDPPAAARPIRVEPRHQSHVRDTLGYAATVGLPVNRAARLAAAVHELTRIAGTDARIRIWSHERTLTCEIAGAPSRQSPTIGRSAGPSLPEPLDRAVRLAGELCDLVQVRLPASGTTIRLHCWLQPT